jgi:NDP-hexose-3-ketoreductase
MMKIGIVCPSEIALRRFLPALSNLPDFKFVGIATAHISEWEGANDDIINKEKEKAKIFTEQYGGKIFESYSSIIESEDIDAIYLPLPPALHYKWAKLALLAGKHILIEKPATTSYKETNELISIARKRDLAMHENYMFAFHNQLTAINDIITQGEIGEVRLYRIAFGFPRRASSDFRYNKQLGGGALLDCGGYTIKYASMLLGETAKIFYAKSNYDDDFDVDIFGSAALINKHGITAQIAFGMDNSYKCDLEVWGSRGCLITGRVLTAPDGFVPEVSLKIVNEIEVRKLPADDAFMKSIQKFQECIEYNSVRNNNYKVIKKQAALIDEFLKKARN